MVSLIATRPKHFSAYNLLDARPLPPPQNSSSGLQRPSSPGPPPILLAAQSPCGAPSSPFPATQRSTLSSSHAHSLHTHGLQQRLNFHCVQSHHNFCHFHKSHVFYFLSIFFFFLLGSLGLSGNTRDIVSLKHSLYFSDILAYIPIKKFFIYVVL